MTGTIIPTRNEGWGFFATLATAGLDAAAGWEVAMQRLADLTEGFSTDEACRDFLDSRMGRHLADEVVDNHRIRRMPLEEAIGTAILAQNRHAISRRESATYGIPAGLPFITGWVQHFEIELEMRA